MSLTMTQPDQSTAAVGAETAPESTAPVATAAENAAAAEPEQPKPTETVEFWKAQAREQEKRAKENAKKAAEFDQWNEAQKTQQQKDAEARQQLLERAEGAERREAALIAAREIDKFKEDITKDPKYAGVPAHALRGSTKEEIEEHAAVLKAMLPEPPPPGQVPGEGRPMSHGTGGPREEFARILNTR